MKENNQKLSKEIIEQLYYEEYDSSITIFHYAYIGNNNKGKRYLMISEDENENEYLVNEITIKKNKNEFILIDMGAMPDFSSSSLKEAKLYINYEVQKYKKYLLNEKLEKNLKPKNKEKKMKI